MPNHYPEHFPLKREDGYDSDLADFLEDGAKVKKLSEINTWIISYSKCFNWHRISKLLSNFGCLFTICYLDRANSIKIA